MTVSQMSIQNSTPSPQQRQHWLSEQVLAWSGLPVVNIRATMFVENPILGQNPRLGAALEEEVRAALASLADFARGPITLGTRGSATSDRGAFVCEDGNYVSARWPGDVHTFARTFVEILAEKKD